MCVQTEEAGEGREPQESHTRQGHQAGAGPGAGAAESGGHGRSQPRPGASKGHWPTLRAMEVLLCSQAPARAPKTRRAQQRDTGFLLSTGERPPRPGNVSSQTQTPDLPKEPISSINPEGFSR